MAGLNNDETRIVSFLRYLLFEADPDADSRQPMSALLLTVWADQFDGVDVWGSIPYSMFLLMNSYSHFGKDFSGGGGCYQGGSCCE